jgi:hypothetical protein
VSRIRPEFIAKFGEDITSDDDVQEALSRVDCDEVIRLLPLKSGAIAVFNNVGELCGVISDIEPWFDGCSTVWSRTTKEWRRP